MFNQGCLFCPVRENLIRIWSNPTAVVVKASALAALMNIMEIKVITVASPHSAPKHTHRIFFTNLQFACLTVK